MPVHYVYKEPVKTRLCQGDVLRKTDALLSHLADYHPYYASHADYKYFLVLTQSCDLVRRTGGQPTSPYITLAAVRPVEEAVRREAAKIQEAWQREAGVIGAKAKSKLVLFLESLLDNNKEGYFYLHTDIGLGIQSNCCAFLRLSVALKAEHYDLCLDAKIAELEEPFQAKLGYLVGHMYSRIGTTEWNDHYPDNKAAKEAGGFLKRTFVTVDERQIKEGIADLRRDGTIGVKTATEIKDYILGKKVLSRKEKLQEEALRVLAEELNPIGLICGRIADPLEADADLQTGIEELLAGSGVEEEHLLALRKNLVAKFMERLSHYLCDRNMPEKRQVLEKILARLLQNPVITNIMQ